MQYQLTCVLFCKVHAIPIATIIYLYLNNSVLINCTSLFTFYSLHSVQYQHTNVLFFTMHATLVCILVLHTATLVLIACSLVFWCRWTCACTCRQLRSMPQSLQMILDVSLSGQSSIGIYGNARTGPGSQVPPGQPGAGFPARQPGQPGGSAAGQPGQPGGYPSGQPRQPGQPGQPGGFPVNQPRQPGVVPVQSQPVFIPGAINRQTGKKDKFTMFLPNDQAFQLIPTQQRSQLVQDTGLFERVSRPISLLGSANH